MTDLFNEDITPQFDQNKNYLEELVGEGKKFKTPEDLAKGKAYADVTIETLTKKMDELRADYLKAREENTTTAKLQDLIDQMESRVNNDTQVATHQKANEDEKSGLKIEDIDLLISDKMSQFEAQKRETANANAVQSKLKERFGEKSQSFLMEQMETLGLTRENVNEMARKQPNVLIRALGLDQVPQTENFQAPPRSALRNDNFAPKGGQKRTWSYYQELRKSKPDLYHDPKTNIQMQKDAIELGDAFMDGDFNN